MRHIAAASCIFIVAGAIVLLRAQQPAAPPFRGGVSLVTVDVTVLDKEGRPVPGLAAEDFQVKLNGKVQPIRALSYLEARTDTTETAAAPKRPVMPQMFPIAEVNEVDVASSAVYRLVVEPPADTKPGREFSLVATVRKSGLTTLANKRAIAVDPAATPPAAAPPNSAGTVEDQLRAALTTGRALDGIPVSLASGVRRAADATQMEIGINVRIAGTAKGPLTAVFGVVDDAGKVRSGRRVIDTPAEGDSYQLTFSVPVTPGVYQLRFAVADAGGRIGAVSAPVRAELAAMGPLAAGDLQLAWLDAVDREQAQFPALDVAPAGAKGLIASLDLFAGAGATAPRDILVKLAFGPAGQPPSIERIVVPSSQDGVFHAEAQFPLERAAPGAYAIQATVLVDGTIVGTKSAPVTLKVR